MFLNLIIRAALLIATLLLSACASPDGPGALETVSPAPAQPTTAVQTAPLPAAVSAQPLDAPGTANAQQSGQPTLQPGSLSLPPEQTQAGQDVTLQDFSQIDPRPVPGSDPFAGQRTATFGQPVQSQETLETAIAGGLEQTTVAPSLVPAAPQWPRVALAPISTAPEPQATQLFDAIDDATFARGMQLVFHGDETAQYIVRSQVSAIPADQVTSLIYVFDVYDAQGTLRHRVSGARAIPRSGPDGWSLVDGVTLQSVADDVAGRMMAWLRDNAA